MEQRPLDFEEPERLPGVESPTRTRNKKLTFYLDIIPITLLALGIGLQYLDQPNWRLVFALGAILACVIYLSSSLLLLWRKRYGTLESVISGMSILFFIVATYVIYLQFFNLELTYQLRSGLKWFGMGVLGIASIGFVFRMRDHYFSDFYRRLLTRLLIIVAILFKGIL